MRGPPLASRDRVEPGRDVLIVIETQDLRLGQGLGQARAVPLGQAAGRHHGGTARGRIEQLINRILLGGLDEPAGVHQNDVSVCGVVRNLPAAVFQPGRQFLGIHLITGAAQRDKPDAAACWAGASGGNAAFFLAGRHTRRLR
jgi:hypothetical protein